ncbi:MAG TPA: iron-siderophore ABC transporter substrate-binding protein, partial [Bacillota bacterium]
MFKRFLSCAAVVTVLLVLAACGSAPGEPSAQPEASGQAEPASAEPAGKAGDETRLVSHAMGETEVPAKPQRVVVLDMGELDMALSLGVQPVGAAFYRADQPLPSYLADKVQGEIERVGTVSQPNLEAIAALEPDLILSNKLRHEDIYDELSQIAPTVFAESLGAAWKEQFAVVAEALGKTEEHAQIMQAYQDAIKAFQQKMGDQLQHTEV